MPANSGVIDGLIAAAKELSDFGRSFVFPCVDKSPGEIARESAEGPWLKSLARRRNGAAEIYAAWADENVPKMAKNARYVINQQQFDILVRRTGEDLLRTLRDPSPDTAVKLGYGVAYRVVDRLFMEIDESERCRHDLIRPFLHAPLDGPTLKPLRGIVDGLVDLDYSLEIPAAAASGFVTTEELYVLLQTAVSNLSRRAGVDPVIYAYWCERS